VSVRPGHKDVDLDANTRLRLAQAAFPDYEVELDPYERTVDMLKAGRWRDPLFLIGADEFSDFLTWKDPNGVVARARLGVATRPGYPRERLDEVLRELDQPERVELFEIEPVPISSREIRERVARGESIDDLVPPAVAELIESLGLYRNGS
jgi:nicotinic acid mononucleotide adenylyltransferase